MPRAAFLGRVRGKAKCDTSGRDFGSVGDRGEAKGSAHGRRVVGRVLAGAAAGAEAESGGILGAKAGPGGCSRQR
jgi:hypothetical protein